MLNERDLRIDVFTSGIHNPVAVRITHIPTGWSVTQEHPLWNTARRLAREKLEQVVMAHSS